MYERERVCLCMRESEFMYERERVSLCMRESQCVHIGVKVIVFSAGISSTSTFFSHDCLFHISLAYFSPFSYVIKQRNARISKQDC